MTRSRRKIEERLADDDALRARAGELAEQVYDIFGFDRDFIPPAWMGMQAWLEAGVRSGWKPDLVRLAARKVAARKKGGPPHNFRYLGPAIVQEHELAAAPPPPTRLHRHRPPPSTDLRSKAMDREAMHREAKNREAMDREAFTTSRASSPGNSGATDRSRTSSEASRCCDPSVAAERLELMLSCWRTARAAEPELYTRALMSVLLHYPAFVGRQPSQ